MGFADRDRASSARGEDFTTPGGGDSASFDARFEAEQLRLIAAQLGRLPVAMLAIDSFIAWMVWRTGRPYMALVLLVTSGAYDIARYIVCMRERRRPSEPARDCLRWLSFAFAGACVLRIAPTPLLFDPQSIELQVMYTMVCVGLAAGGVATVGGVFWPYAVWASVVGGTLSVAWAVQGSFARCAVGALVALMFATLALYARDQGRTLRRFWELVHMNEVLANSLRVERDRAEQASRSKTRFFAAASHDLRQPLHALSINATTLELIAQRQADSVIRELSGSITRALRQSNELLDTLLDISQLDAQIVETRIEAVDGGRLLHELREEFAATASQRGLELTVRVSAGLPPLLTDERQLRRLLGNLIGNALKFTRVGGVVLALERDAGDDGLVVTVTDTGPGIPESEQERVFEDFYQIGNVARDRSLGLGLGLSIVRRTAVLIGSRLSLRSVPGDGCCFGVHLPCADAPVKDERMRFDLQDAHTRLASLSPNVLAIDDETEILDSLAALLPRFGCVVRCAVDLPAAEASLADGFRPDLLMVDYRLKGTSGLEVIAALRARCGPVPSVIVTGDTVPRTIAGDTVVIHKPIDGQLLAQAMVSALTMQRAAPA